MLLIAADYPFLDVLWTIIIFFAWVIFIWIAITVLIDVFRRQDIGGWQKAAWVVLVIVLPFLGVLVYLIAQHEGMRERGEKQARAQQQAFDQYVREAAGGSAGEIAKAKELLDAGTINQAEFDGSRRRQFRKSAREPGARTSEGSTRERPACPCIRDAASLDEAALSLLARGRSAGLHTRVQVPLAPFPGTPAAFAPPAAIRCRAASRSASSSSWWRVERSSRANGSSTRAVGHGRKLP